LIRPALEAKKAGLSYTYLAKAIAAALLFDPQEDKEAMKLQANIHEYGIEYVLKEVSGLEASDDLTKEIIAQYNALKS